MLDSEKTPSEIRAACKAILCQHDAYQQPILPEIETKLRAAIAKAEGR